MIEIFFTIDGIEQKQVVVLYSDEDLKNFIKTHKEQVLEQYPTANDIRLGQLSVGIWKYNFGDKVEQTYLQRLQLQAGG